MQKQIMKLPICFRFALAGLGSTIVFNLTRNKDLIRSVELLNYLVRFGARQAIPLRDLKPESVGTWPAVSSTQREDLEY
jgi:hypothetical protein